MGWREIINDRLRTLQRAGQHADNATNMEPYVAGTGWDAYSDGALEAAAALDARLKAGIEEAERDGRTPYPDGLGYDGAQTALKLREEQRRIIKALARDLQLYSAPQNLPKFDPIEWQDYLTYLNEPGKEFPIARQSLLELSIVSTHVLREGLMRGLSYTPHRTTYITKQLPEAVADAFQIQFRSAKDGNKFTPDIGNGYKYDRAVDMVVSTNRSELYQALLEMPVKDADACLRELERVFSDGFKHVEGMAAGSKRGTNDDNEFYWSDFGKELERGTIKKYFQVIVPGISHVPRLERFAKMVTGAQNFNLDLSHYEAQFQEDIDNARRERMHQLARVEPDSFEQKLRMERLEALAQLPAPAATKALG